MKTQQFLDTVIGDEGYYCIFAVRGERRVQKFYKTIQEVVIASEHFDDDGFDVYYALATFGTAESRKQQNVKQMRSLYLDLDCGPNKEFPSQMKAIDALKKFCTTLGLPRPTLVSSGRGVHVYWPLIETAEPVEWFRVAERLKAACAEQGFDADPAVTSDMARVLRVPGTHNHKDDPASPVRMLATAAEPVGLVAFAKLLGGTLKPVLPPMDLGPDPVFDALIANTENSFANIIRKTKAGRGCDQIKHIVQNQDDIGEPLWRAGLSIAKFCTDGDKAAVVMSRNHPDYDYDVMQRKLYNIRGPYLCSRFDEYNPGICSGCPNFGKLKSPINLGKVVLEADPEEEVEVQELGEVKKITIPTYPNPYFRGKNGGIYLRIKDDDGDTIEECVYHNDFYMSRRLYDAELGEVVVMQLHLPNDPKREFSIPMRDVTSKDEFRKVLGTNGLSVYGKNLERLMVYVMKWIDELQATGGADEAHKQFGWVDDNMDAFVLGDRLIKGNEVEYNPPSSQTKALIKDGAFDQKGEIEKSRSLLEFYNKPGFEMHQFVVASVLGSVLMEFTGLNSLAINLYGKSGVGKTTAMMAGLSIFGDPMLLMNHRNDTHNSRLNRGEVMKNLALCSDEMTNIKSHEASEYVYQMSGGRQKNRMSSSGNTERFRGDPWALIAISTTNTSLWEILSREKARPDAELLRLLEINVQKQIKDPALKVQTDALFEDFKRNFGWLGTEFIQYIISNREECRTLVKDVRSRIDKAADLSSEHRFWSAGVACAIAANIIAGRVGILNYNTAEIFSWVVDELKQRKGFVNESGTSVETTLNNYAAENYNNILWIKSTDDLRATGEHSGIDSLVVPDALPKTKLVARYETDTKRFFLLPKPLKNWCTDQQIAYSEFVKDLQEKMGATKQKMRITKGTHMNLPATDVIVVEFKLEE